MSRKTIVGTARLLAVTAFATLLATPLEAQTVEELVSFRPDNRAGSAAAATVIAEMIAERSQSAAVRSRARSIAPEGSLTVAADELLMDIGAHAFIAAIRGGDSGAAAVVPAGLTSPTRPVAPPPAPVVEPIARPAAAPAVQPAATPEPTATPTSTAATAAPASPPRRNWGISEEFSGSMRDLGGSTGGGGGGGGGGSGGGGGGGGWN